VAHLLLEGGVADSHSVLALKDFFSC
jgi:hypothetical protein